MPRSFRLIACLLFACAGMWAQSTAQIQGVVQDATGSAIPGVDIKATQTDTGAIRTTTSGNDGGYVLTSLPVGPYRLEASRTGFSTFVQTGIVLQVASNPTVDIALKVGAVSDQVQVEANAALIETERTSIGNVIENQRIIELPLNGRNVNDLIVLAGAAIPAGSPTGASIPGAAVIVVAGGQTSGVQYYLDGGFHDNQFDGTGMPFPFPDALQEFKVETSSLNAQEGAHSGASINAVTKSGTNAFHGDAFEFLRNGDVNARNFFSTSQDTLKRNQFGGTVGGPIKKNKLFFFAGYQDTKVRQEAVSSIGFVPTAQMLAGDFTQFASPACNGGKQITLRAPFVNNIDPLPLDPAALKVAKFLPSTTDPCGRTTFGAPTVTDLWQVIGRVDYQLNEKHTIFGRFMNTAFFQPAGYGLSKNVLSTATVGGHDQNAISMTLGDTYLLSSTVVNSFRAAFNRTANHSFNDSFFNGCDVGVQMTCYLAGQTALSVTGGPVIGGCCVVNTILNPTSYNLNDDVSIVRGAHQISFGFSAYQYRSSTIAVVFAQGIFSFSGAATGLGMADFLTGNLSKLTQSAPNTLLTRKNYVGSYVQDTWKISPRLTANIGVRWEPFLPQIMTNGAVYNFSLADFYANVKSTQFTNAPPGLRFPGDSGFDGNSGMAARYGLFTPRVGLAWDPKGDGKTSIRASFGMSYDFVNGQFFANTATAPPWANTTTVQGPVSFDTPYATFPGGSPFPYAVGANTKFAPYGTYIALLPNGKPTTVNAWNFAIQRQFGSNWLVSATYAGNETSHLWQTYALNPAALVPNTAGTPTGTCPPGVLTGCNSTANVNQRRILNNPLIGYMDQFTDGGTSGYNGLILAMQRRLSKGVSIQANYTWSHCIGDETQGSWVGGSGVGLLYPNNRRFDRGNCGARTSSTETSTDRRQIFNLTAVAITPRFANNTLRMMGSGWKVSGIYRFSTGPYLTAFTAVDQQLSGQSNERLVQVLPNPLCANPNPSCWINPAAFANPAFGTLTNMSPDNILGPGFFTLDMAISREFKLREKATLEFRAEGFNITNSFRAGNSANTGTSGVTTTLSNTFGQILSAMDPRILQFAGKIVF